MSTRCQIGFYKTDDAPLYKWDALIYRHSDGYPNTEHGVLATLMPILADFAEHRGLSDTEYAAAWVVAKLKDDYLNIGISRELHGDIEYFYAVTPNLLKVYEAQRDGGDGWYGFNSLRHLKTYSVAIPA